MTDDTQPTRDALVENLHHVLSVALEYVDGEELAAAVDALLVKSWACIKRENNLRAAVVMDDLTRALDLYIKCKD